MEAYVDEVRKLEERFDSLQAEHVPRAENSISRTEQMKEGRPRQVLSG